MTWTKRRERSKPAKQLLGPQLGPWLLGGEPKRPEDVDVVTTTGEAKPLVKCDKCGGIASGLFELVSQQFGVEISEEKRLCGRCGFSAPTERRPVFMKKTDEFIFPYRYKRVMQIGEVR